MGKAPAYSQGSLRHCQFTGARDCTGNLRLLLPLIAQMINSCNDIIFLGGG